MRKKVKRISCILLALAVWIAGLQVPVMEVNASEEEWEYSEQRIGTFVAYGNGCFVSVGDGGKVWVSQNGYTWKQKGRIAVESRIGGLDYCGEYFFVYGSLGEVYLSKDGCKWSRVSIGRGCILKIVYGEGKYVANVGLHDIVSGSMWEYDGFGIYDSDNGINWQFSESVINNKMMDIAYGNGCFVAVGEDNILSKKKGKDYWEKHFMPEVMFKGVTYGNGMFIATTEYNGFFSSVDGVNWKQETGCYGEKIAYYNSCFYVWNPSSYYGNCLYVKDYMDNPEGEWIRELDRTQYGQIMDVACGNGKIVITTNEGVVIREEAESPEARLSSLGIKQGNLECAFQPDKTSYRATVGQALDSIELSAKAMEAHALITVKGPNQVSRKLINGGSISLGLEEGDTVFEITVLSEDKLETETYFLTVVKKPQYKVSVKEAVGGYATGAAYVEEGGSAALTAVPGEGFQFVCWEEENTEISRDDELILTDVQNDREILPVFEPVPDCRISFVPKEISAVRGEEFILKLDTTEEEEGYHDYRWRLLNGSNSAIKELWYEEENGVQVTVGEKEIEDTLYIQCYEYFYNYNGENVSEEDRSICTAVISVVQDQKTYQITAASSDEQAGTVTGGGSMTENENMLLTAKANPGYYFVEWQENGSSYSREESLILSGITEDMSLTAVFEQKKLESVQIARKPLKCSYKAGEQFDTKGMLVKAVYNDGSWKFIADYDYIPKEALTVGDSHVQIVYEDAGVRKAARVTVKVSGDEKSEQDREDSRAEDNQQPGGDKEEDNNRSDDDKEGNNNNQPDGDKEGNNNNQPDGDKKEDNKKPGGGEAEDNQQPEDGKEENNQQPDEGKEADKKEDNNQPDGDKGEDNQRPDDGKDEKEDNNQSYGGEEEDNQRPDDEKKEKEDDDQPDNGKEEDNQQPGDDKEEDDKEEDDKEEDNNQSDDNRNEEDMQPGDVREEDNSQPEGEKKGEENPTNNPAPDKTAPVPGNSKVQDEKKPETNTGSKKIFAGAAVQSGNYKYKIVKIEKNGNGQVHLTGAKKALVTVKVPESIKLNGKTFKVTGIGENAFKNQKKLKKVIIGGNVQKIGAKAFYGCSKLTSITVKAKNLQKIGKKAFQGTPKKIVADVPKKRYKKYAKLLKGKGFKGTIKIKKK